MVGSDTKPDANGGRSSTGPSADVSDKASDAPSAQLQAAGNGGCPWRDTGPVKP